MFKVQFVRMVPAEGEVYWATLDLELPFVPYPGLHVAFVSDDEGGYPIREVTWEVPAQRFVAAFDPWDTPGFTWERRLAWLQRAGWRIEKDTTGPDAEGE
jgi:hypothetical protein